MGVFFLGGGICDCNLSMFLLNVYMCAWQLEYVLGSLSAA